ncbi:MAG: NAD(P)/FAD-dependent oxidoreductase [Candidatus Omnitrophica bacterium]|nr:NAD(P)/FAD-dependent oxidoreductase [Candidatus Omnitrophota bacterium]
MNTQFDAIFVGSGIGSLICANYLSKAGLKVLIIEKHDKPGGYCTSFERKGYKFDIGVHYLGGIKRGILGKTLRELQMDESLEFSQADPTDKIIFPDNTTYIRACPKNTLTEFQKSFPKERKNLEKFFGFILQEQLFNIYKKVKGQVFQETLDYFFRDPNLKSVLGGLSSNIALSPKKAAAISAIILFREYVLDSGYYPKGGIQTLPNMLVKKLKERGGEIIFSRKVVKIITTNKIKKVILDTSDEIASNIIISNADVSMTFGDLIDVKTKELNTINKLTPSPSMFLVYLGLKENAHNEIAERINTCYFATYDIEKVYSRIYSQQYNILNADLDYFFCCFPSAHDISLSNTNRPTMQLFIYSPYISKKFWDENKIEVGNRIIKKSEKVFYDLRNLIDVKIFATPHTFHRYTLNKNGAVLGWVSTLNQIKSNIIPQRTSIDGIYLVGHWTTTGSSGQGGIPNVAFSGRRCARLILEDLGKHWPFGK